MSKKMQKGVILLAIVVAVFVAISFGVVTKSELEDDARKSQNIPEAWKMSQSVSDEIGAMIFYEEELEQYKYVVYLNKPGASFGYVYRDGGQLKEIADGIAGCSYSDMGTALISMNKVNAVRVELTKGKEQGTPLKSWDLEAGTPFAVVIPAVEDNDNDIYLSIYDKDGKQLSSSIFASEK